MNSIKELTTKQQKIVDFILKRQRADGITPTQREIADEFGFTSQNSVAQHLRLIRQKGHLKSGSGKARSLRITSPLAKLRNRLADIPIFGTIPAGTPQTREQEAEGCTTVDVKSLGFAPTRNTFALCVTGDSMIGKHICDVSTPGCFMSGSIFRNFQDSRGADRIGNPKADPPSAFSVMQ